MYTFSILHPAVQDLKEAAEWYNLQQKGLGHLFLKRIREKGRFISSYPLACPVRYSEIRVAKVNQFPFLIHYYIAENKHGIIIIAVLHTSLSPQKWQKRVIR